MIKLKKIEKQKKKGMNWGLVLIGLLAGGSYLWDKAKKKKLAEEQAQTYKDRLLPPVKQQITLPAETSASPESRLNGMGINTGVPGSYQKTGENYKEIQ